MDKKVKHRGMAAILTAPAKREAGSDMSKPVPVKSAPAATTKRQQRRGR